MSLVLGDNFSYQGAKPLDARLKYDTLAQMKAMADSVLYDGCLAFCKEDSKTYQWISTNEVDSVTGRWREFKSGSGGSVDLEYDTEPTAKSEKLMKSGDLKTAFDKKQDTMAEMTAAEVDAICTISDEDPTDGAAHMLFPNTWAPGVEYNFGHGVYGQRWTGSFEIIKSKTEGVGARQWVCLDRTIFSNGGKIIKAGGEIKKSTNTTGGDTVYLQAGNTDMDSVTGDILYANVLRDKNKLCILCKLLYSGADTSIPYDVWAIYTKS